MVHLHGAQAGEEQSAVNKESVAEVQYNYCTQRIKKTAVKKHFSMELKTNACYIQQQHTAYTQFFRVLQKLWTDDCLLISFHLL